MVRQHLADQHYRAEPDFRWRGGEVTRIEGFTDAVFAFGVTLLVVSLEVPKTYNELLETMHGFLAFGICFAILVSLWHVHYIFSRRYGLQDTFTIVLNAILIFLVLFFIYPLKFLFTFVVNAMFFHDIGIHRANGVVEDAIQSGQAIPMMLIYNGGYLAVMAIYALLFFHAYRKREALQLNEREAFDTRSSIEGFLIQGGVGLLSSLIVLIGKENAVALAGFSYFLIGPARGFHGWWRGRQHKKFENVSSH
jgi:uncharacterized membrane protein